MESVESVELLLKNGANRFIRNKKGELPGASILVEISREKRLKILALLAEM
jgi:hypothetical protein